jgi:RNA polymerase sigma-70 factor (ECF subfamily)
MAGNSETDLFSDTLIGALPMLRAFARSLCGNRTLADDLVQETAVRALANRDSFTPGTNFNAWVITILRNHFYSEGRKRRREVEDVDDRMASHLPDAPGQEGHVAMTEFLHAMQEIPDEQREALILVGASGFSYEEAAGVCGVRIGTIKSRVSRARTRLLALLGEDQMTGGRAVADDKRAPLEPSS